MNTPNIVPTANWIPGYIEFLPDNYDSTKSYPLVISQHGNGSEDGENSGGVGSSEGLTSYLNNKSHLPYYITSGQVNQDVIIICSQTKDGWLDGNNLVRLINHLKEKYNPSGLAFMGLSAGGAGVWKAIRDHVDIIDVAIPICGATTLKSNTPPDNVKIWAHHAINDGTIGASWTGNNLSYIVGDDSSLFVNKYREITQLPLNKSSRPLEDVTLGYENNEFNKTLNPENFNILGTIYKDGGHGIWGRVYKRDDVWSWIIEQINLLNPTPDPEPDPEPTPDPDPTPEPEPTPEVSEFAQKIQDIEKIMETLNNEQKRALIQYLVQEIILNDPKDISFFEDFYNLNK